MQPRQFTWSQQRLMQLFGNANVIHRKKRRKEGKDLRFKWTDDKRLGATNLIETCRYRVQIAQKN